METAILLSFGAVVVILALVVASKRWMWLVLFGLATLASAFTVIASIIHFQILGAVGFTALTFVLFAIFAVIYAGADPT